ncbi:MAG: DUF4301 family protein [Marinifilaceae bacterium]|jgi:hypothetical protein|nr:DUF4301 family protein [Marinifilaceae bacterium]
MFTAKDKKYIKSHKISLEDIKQQMINFKNGFPKIELETPALVDDGIILPSEEQINRWVSDFDYKKSRYSITKFVPASGAATRMFAKLYDFLEEYDGSHEQYLQLIADKSEDGMNYFFQNIHKLPFYKDLKDHLLLRGYFLDKLIEKCEYKFILESLLNKDGLNYGELPKALIKFHSHIESAMTPLEEHLVEAAHYCKSNKGVSHINFTVSEEYLKMAKKYLKENRRKYEKKHNTKFKISLSVQNKSTDCIALDIDRNVVRDEEGLPLLRPSGHGALLMNLNSIKSDIIFIKNIDNVLPDRYKPETYRYKKALAGLLINIQEKVFTHLRTLKKSNIQTPNKLNEILDFCNTKLFVKHPKEVYHYGTETLVKYLIGVLDRPIRVCGMVLNEGEPGGGPFWVKNKDMSISLQIIEKSQIDTSNPEQKKILEASTHFNPVDIVCGTKNEKGKHYDLSKFINPETGFISTKTYKGEKITIQELPGLWNGSMAYWNTIFVEVPSETFSPVKTVQDLFKIEHRNIL